VIRYKITVLTGGAGAGAGDTDVMEPAVHLTLFGRRGDGGRRLLFIANDRSHKFQPLQVSTALRVAMFVTRTHSI